MVDTIFNYKGSNNRDAKCRIQIFEQVGRIVIVATELADNSGYSITNAAEQIVAEVCRKFNIDPEKLIWVEYYPPKKSTASRCELVQFNWDGQYFSRPRWASLSKQEIELFIGQSL